jgi:hypothetical protein
MLSGSLHESDSEGYKFLEEWCESAASSGKGCTLNPELNTGDYFST